MYINLITKKSIVDNKTYGKECNHQEMFTYLDGFIFQSIPFLLNIRKFDGNLSINAVLTQNQLDNLNSNIGDYRYKEGLKLDEMFKYYDVGRAIKGLKEKMEYVSIFIPPHEKDTYSIPTSDDYLVSKTNAVVSWQMKNQLINRTDEDLLDFLVGEEFIDENLYKIQKERTDESGIVVDLDYINNFIFKVTMLAKNRYFFASENDTREYEYDLSDIHEFICQNEELEYLYK